MTARIYDFRQAQQIRRQRELEADVERHSRAIQHLTAKRARLRAQLIDSGQLSIFNKENYG